MNLVSGVYVCCCCFVVVVFFCLGAWIYILETHALYIYNIYFVCVCSLLELN